MLLCPANSASTRTPTPLLASWVMNVRRGVCEVAPRNPQSANTPKNSWHMVLALKCPPLRLSNKGAVGRVLYSVRRYCSSALRSARLMYTVRVRARLVWLRFRTNASRTAPSASYASPIQCGKFFCSQSRVECEGEYGAVSCVIASCAQIALYAFNLCVIQCTCLCHVCFFSCFYAHKRSV